MGLTLLNGAWTTDPETIEGVPARMGDMIAIRAGMGLGDSLYLQSVARHLIEQGQQRIEICSKWPDVFRPISENVIVSGFRRTHIDRICHYVMGKNNRKTDQWQDCCDMAGIPKTAELRLDWEPVNVDLIDSVREKARDRPVIAVLLPRAPMDRIDGYGEELLPDCNVIQRAIDMLRERGAFIVQVGRGEPLFRFDGIHLDLANKTSVCDVIDLGFSVDGFLGYVSFFIPLSESFRKPALYVWSSRGLQSKTEYIRTITPKKIFHRPATSTAVADDCQQAELAAAVDAFLVLAGRRLDLQG